jgi:hypothetical protein
MADRSPHRSAFGRLLVDPTRLSQPERVGLLAEAVPRLKAGTLDAETGAWIAGAFEKLLRGEGSDDLTRLLGLRPARGSHRSPAQVSALQLRDDLLLRLSNEVGGDGAALAVVKAERTCPPRALPVLEQLQALPPAKSSAAFTRARKRVSRHRT